MQYIDPTRTSKLWRHACVSAVHVHVHVRQVIRCDDEVATRCMAWHLAHIYYMHRHIVATVTSVEWL